MTDQEALFADLEPLLAGIGLALLEFTSTRGRTGMHVRVVVYARSGTGTAECVAAHRVLYPRLQVLLGVQDIHLEIASPGIDRTLKSEREWTVFTGKNVRILLKAGGEWIRGTIVGMDQGRVTVETAGTRNILSLADIAKARLDASQGG